MANLNLSLLILGTFNSLNITSKGGQFNVTQDLNKGCPGYWLLASPSQQFLEDLGIDMFQIVMVIVGNVVDPGAWTHWCHPGEMFDGC